MDDRDHADGPAGTRRAADTRRVRSLRHGGREIAESWRLVDSGPGAGAWNLGLDEALFESVRERRSPPTLRLYRWSAPTLTIGYFQDPGRDLDLDACRSRGIAVLRRATGGRAVLHAAEVTYSFSAPAGLPGFGPGLYEAYRRIAGGLVRGLRLLGLDARLAAPAPRGSPRPPRHPGCFAATGRHEIEIDGRKLIGSAQRRRGDAFLQHGSILLAEHGALLEQLLRTPAAGVSTANMAGLQEFLRPCPSPAGVAAAIAAGCAAAWGVRFLRGDPDRTEVLRAQELSADRGRSRFWNPGRALADTGGAGGGTRPDAGDARRGAPTAGSR